MAVIVSSVTLARVKAFRGPATARFWGPAFSAYHSRERRQHALLVKGFKDVPESAD